MVKMATLPGGQYTAARVVAVTRIHSFLSCYFGYKINFFFSECISTSFRQNWKILKIFKWLRFRITLIRFSCSSISVGDCVVRDSPRTPPPLQNLEILMKLDNFLREIFSKKKSARRVSSRIFFWISCPRKDVIFLSFDSEIFFWASYWRLIYANFSVRRRIDGAQPKFFFSFFVIHFRNFSRFRNFDGIRNSLAGIQNSKIYRSSAR